MNDTPARFGESASVSRTLLWIAGGAVALLFLVAVAQVLLLIFAGMLLALPLRAAADAIAARLGIGAGWVLAGLLVAIAAVVGLGGWFLVPAVTEQAQQLADQVPRAWDDLQDRLGGILGDRTIDRFFGDFASPSRSTLRDLLSRLVGAVSGTVGALGSAFVIFFTGLYLAADPGTYRRGLVRLVPPRHRGRARDVMDQVASALLRWLIGKLVSMTLVGVLTYAGLWALGVPLALSLSLLACALTFIPNFGPILSACPAVLLALGQGPADAGWVVGLYLAVQTIESYLVTPLIQQRTVSLPPALTLGMQIILGVLAGVSGLALATPLTAAGFVLVRELYVRDMLEEPREARCA